MAEGKIVLGINDGHPSTVCLFKNGRIVSCISEERLDRIKNSCNFPILSIKQVLKDANIHAEDVDLIAFSSRDITPVDLNELAKRTRDTRLGVRIFSSATKFLPMYLTEGILTKIATKARQLLKLKEFYFRYRKILEKLGFIRKDVIFYDHHLVHAATAHFLNPFNRLEKNRKRLVFTCDGEGDGLCATVSVAYGVDIQREVAIPFVHSIAKMYNEVTWYLGLKPWDHEYKVMGMAPYAKEYHAERTWKIFEKMMEIDKKDKRKFRNLTHTWADSYGNYLRDSLYKHRFDNIAYGIQKLTEKILTSWIRENITFYEIQDVELAGGVFMNVKANQKIMEMEEVNSIFVVPSSGDESSAIGAAILGYLDLCKLDGVKINITDISPLKDLYFGPTYSEEQIRESIKKHLGKTKFNVEYYDNISEIIGNLLYKGKIVARFDDRMEFGARALGNRSILANPKNLEVVRELNSIIKSRDFWMPFAPTILREYSREYLEIPEKDVDDQYMIISFDTKENAKKKLIAALHQSDFTCRPQILDEKWNKKYYDVIKYFEEKTGIGAVLNTSFNLHGEPIVCSPDDAISTMKRSGLEYLALGNYLIEKK